MLELRPERLRLDEYQDQPIAFCGKTFRADVSGALYWHAERMLILADPYFAKPDGRAGRGAGATGACSRETLRRLAAAIDRFEPTTIVCLGDGLNGTAADRLLLPADFETLAILQRDRDWIWVRGPDEPEHDRHLGGYAMGNFLLAGIALRHAPTKARVTHEIAGGLAPAARVVVNGHALRCGCFVGNGVRLLLPAFGAPAGTGRNVLDDAFRPLLGEDGLQVWMIGEEGLYPIAARLLADD